MIKPEKLKGNCLLYAGDCLVVLDQLDENSIDSCCTDPPYHLTSIVKRFGGKNSAPAKSGKSGVFKRSSSGFMGKKWDGGDIAFRKETWEKVLDVLKPGAYLLAFCGTRNYHRMAVAIEDAGFEIRDCIQWIYGSGFPKSQNISMFIDRELGAERGKRREYHTRNPRSIGGGRDGLEGATRPYIEEALKKGYHELDDLNPVTDEAKEYDGFGTALKPACELICVARKPLSEKTVAANVLKWGTGALNIDSCRVGDEELKEIVAGQARLGTFERRNMITPARSGRWPANVILDGSDEVVEAFPETGMAKEARTGIKGGENALFMSRGNGANATRVGSWPADDGGSAARFFYTAKSDAEDRLGSAHPTKKPTDLIQYLARLITPKGGTCLDCFAGTGTLGEACYRGGFKSILIEREEEYQRDIRKCMSMVDAGRERRHIERGKELRRQGRLKQDLGGLWS